MGFIFEKYFNWLLNKVDARRSRYEELMLYLFNKEFTWLRSIVLDEDRAANGLYLRKKFIERNEEYTEIVKYHLNGKCSVLEMMVALSEDCVNNLREDSEPGKWFWIMIKNLELDHMTNGNFDYQEAERIMDICLKRKYGPNGKGGFFIDREGQTDMRTLHIWYQLNRFVMNEYPIMSEYF